jgi:hypothetical protein
MIAKPLWRGCRGLQADSGRLREGDHRTEIKETMEFSTHTVLDSLE